MDINEKINEIACWMESASILDLKTFLGVLESRLGVKSRVNQFHAESFDHYSIILNHIKDVYSNKIPVIKELRVICSTDQGLMGLKDAKDMSEKENVLVKEKLTLKEALDIKSKLEKAGAKVTVENHINGDIWK
jgi:ribosomal protein L7/L12